MLSIMSDCIMFECPSKLLLNVLVISQICGSYIVLTTVGGWCFSTVLSPSYTHNTQIAIPTALVLMRSFTRVMSLVGNREYKSLCHLTSVWNSKFHDLFYKTNGRLQTEERTFRSDRQKGIQSRKKLRPLHSVALLWNVPLRLPCSSVNNSKAGREENVPQ